MRLWEGVFLLKLFFPLFSGMCSFVTMWMYLIQRISHYWLIDYQGLQLLAPTTCVMCASVFKLNSMCELHQIISASNYDIQTFSVFNLKLITYLIDLWMWLISYYVLDGPMNVVNLELIKESLIFWPKEPNVRDIVHCHSKTLQPQPKRPSHL